MRESVRSFTVRVLVVMLGLAVVILTPAVFLAALGQGDDEPFSDPRFQSCKAAKAAGYGPYVEAVDSEYDWYRDADGDGVVCE